MRYFGCKLDECQIMTTNAGGQQPKANQLRDFEIFKISSEISRFHVTRLQ